MVIYGIYEVVLIDGSVKCHTSCPNRSTNEEVKLVSSAEHPGIK